MATVLARRAWLYYTIYSHNCFAFRYIFFFHVIIAATLCELKKRLFKVEVVCLLDLGHDYLSLLCNPSHRCVHCLFFLLQLKVSTFWMLYTVPLPIVVDAHWASILEILHFQVLQINFYCYYWALHSPYWPLSLRIGYAGEDFLHCRGYFCGGGPKDTNYLQSTLVLCCSCQLRHVIIKPSVLSLLRLC